MQTRCAGRTRLLGSRLDVPRGMDEVALTRSTTRRADSRRMPCSRPWRRLFLADADSLVTLLEADCFRRSFA